VIDFRYHVVSIVAVFLALAVGIVLGSTAFAGPVTDTLGTANDSLRRTNEQLRNDIAALEDTSRYQDDFVAGLAPAVLPGKLMGQRVVIVVLPGADTQVVDEVAGMLRQAGASETGRVTLTDAYVATDQRAALGDVARQVAPRGVELPAGTPHAQAGAVLASALVTPGPALAAEAGPEAVRALEAFESGGFIDLTGDPAAAATTAVLVAGPAPEQPTDDTRLAANGLVALAMALDVGSRGAVVAGDVRAAADGGVIGALRSTDAARRAVSSVDEADTAAGQVTVALALAEEIAGRTGQFGGAGNADRAGPTPTPAS
jgi:hypothetical protein